MASAMIDPKAAEVLRFWFEEHPKDWFVKNPAFDAEIRARFLALHEAAAAGQLAHWADDPRTCLALVIVLDQFPRNIFRGTPLAFATDAQALAVARGVVSRGFDAAYLPAQRWFAYLPFEHAEDLAAQRESLVLYERLRGDPPSASPIAYAQRHYAVIERFGRFPHRNAILGRDSTPAEREFLATPGSSF
jgi:uncharacterized protein (DUF924 family)